jgi:hypothetical protein
MNKQRASTVNFITQEMELLHVVSNGVETTQFGPLDERQFVKHELEKYEDVNKLKIGQRFYVINVSWAPFSKPFFQLIKHK